MIVNGAINIMPEESVSRAVDLATAAESLGYSRCWVYDEGLASRDVYVTLAAIALATNKLVMGPGITNPYTRHAGSTAAAIATLDELSGGRALLGVGAGGSLTLHPMGITWQHPLASVRETIDACRRLFQGETVTCDGREVALNQASIGYARPSTEIWLAGRGPKMLALGGKACDGVMLDFIYKPRLAGSVERVRNAAATVGNQPRLSYSTAVITDEQAMDRVKPHMTYRLVDSPAEVKAEIGLSETDEKAIRNAMNDGLEAAAEFVREEWVHHFVIAGNEDECKTEIADLVEQFDLAEFLLPLLDDQSAVPLMTTVAKVLEL